MEGIHTLSSLSLYRVRYLLLYNVSVSQMCLILFLTDVVCSECPCSSNMCDYLSPPGVSSKT